MLLFLEESLLLSNGAQSSAMAAPNSSGWDSYQESGFDARTLHIENNNYRICC